MYYMSSRKGSVDGDERLTCYCRQVEMAEVVHTVVLVLEMVACGEHEEHQKLDWSALLLLLLFHL